MISPLRQWRYEHEVSLYSLSKKTGVDVTTLSRFERTGNCMAYTLCQIADAIGVSTDWLLGREERC